MLLQFNHKYNNNIAIVDIHHQKFIIKAYTSKEWDVIVDSFENLTDVLHNKEAIEYEINKWLDIPLLYNLGTFIKEIML